MNIHISLWYCHVDDTRTHLILMRNGFSMGSECGSSFGWMGLRIARSAGTGVGHMMATMTFAAARRRAWRATAVRLIVPFLMKPVSSTTRAPRATDTAPHTALSRGPVPPTASRSSVPTAPAALSDTKGHDPSALRAESSHQAAHATEPVRPSTARRPSFGQLPAKLVVGKLRDKFK